MRKSLEALENLAATPEPEATSVELGSFGEATEPEEVEVVAGTLPEPEIEVEAAPIGPIEVVSALIETVLRE